MQFTFFLTIANIKNSQLAWPIKSYKYAYSNTYDALRINNVLGRIKVHFFIFQVKQVESEVENIRV